MVRIASAEEMQSLDRETTQQAGISAELLMENAGLYAALWLARTFPSDTRFLCLCGPGNNGGDGFVTARHLARMGFRPRVIFAGDMAKAREIINCGVFEHLMCLTASLVICISLSMDSFEAAQTAHSRLMVLIGLFGIDKLNPNETARAHLIGSELYCKYGKTEEALEQLEQYVNICLTTFFPLKMTGDSFFTDIAGWLEEGELGAIPPLDEGMIKQNMLASLAALPSKAALHDNPRYKFKGVEPMRPSRRSGALCCVFVASCSFGYTTAPQPCPTRHYACWGASSFSAKTASRCC